MNEKIVSEVLKRLDNFGAIVAKNGVKLGEEAVRYTFVQNMGYLIRDVLFVILVPIFCYFILKKCFDALWKLKINETFDPVVVSGGD